MKAERNDNRTPAPSEACLQLAHDGRPRRCSAHRWCTISGGQQLRPEAGTCAARVSDKCGKIWVPLQTGGECACELARRTIDRVRTAAEVFPDRAGWTIGRTASRAGVWYGAHH